MRRAALAAVLGALLAAALAGPAAGAAPARASPAAPDPAKPLIVFVVVGHSNMDGLARQTCEGPLDRCWAWNGTAWVPPPRDHGPMPHLLKALAAAYPEYEFGALKYIRRSGSISRDFGPGRSAYLALLEGCRSLPPETRLAGVVSMLGWVDARDPADSIARFGDGYAGLIAGLRRDLGRPDLPFIVSELEYGRPPIERPLTDWQAVFDAIRALPKRLPDVHLVPSLQEPAFYQDDHHYTHDGHAEWSRRAVAVIREARLVPRAAARPPGRVAGPPTTHRDLPKGRIAEVAARLVRISAMRPPDRLAPYNHCLVTAEYEVLRQTGGAALPKRIIVVHWSIRERRPAAPFGFRPGQVHDLALAWWDPADPEVKGEPMDDDILSAEPMFFALACTPTAD